LFSLYKFRTMLDATDADGKPLPDASRLTPFGKWLRASSLDELPELLNVIRGDMSLVGPRPLLPEYLPLYSARQARRHEMLPGLTGLAQVSGRNSLSWDDRLELDVQYVEHWTLALDIQILLRTVGSVLSSEGISAPGHVSMEKFTGSASAPSDQSGGHQ
jgi:lipopolysaccharide/colanic/teichoic acid biosynthesis glycosyltransferase